MFPVLKIDYAVPNTIKNFWSKLRAFIIAKIFNNIQKCYGFNDFIQSIDDLEIKPSMLAFFYKLSEINLHILVFLYSCILVFLHSRNHFTIN